MRSGALIFIAISTSVLLSSAAPFQIQDGELQRHRRRAVDYPLDSVPLTQSSRKLRKRFVPYSVVQVDGGSSSSVAAAPRASTVTVTQAGSTPAPSTQIVLTTSTIPGPASDQTVVLTTTREIANTVTASAATILATTTDTATATALPASTLVSVTTATAGLNPTTDGDIPTQTDQVTSTVLNTILNTVTSTAVDASPTAYYDDGMWHTYYPVKTFVPPSLATSSVAVNARALNTKSQDSQYAAASPPAGRNNGTSTANAERRASEAESYNAYKPRRASAPPEAYATPGERLANHARRNEAPYTPSKREASTTQTRKAPSDLRLASYNITRTEMTGMERFKN